jgi:hypothetical protein
MTSKGWGSQASVDSYLMHWREDNGASIGEGLSRTSDPNAKLYEIVVTFSGMRPMREQLRATHGPPEPIRQLATYIYTFQ